MMHKKLLPHARHAKNYQQTLKHYQVDRSKASGQHSTNEAEKIFLAKHNILFWSA
jgi:hypothetical protein